ncbi:hypothetical protein CC1G_13069 [Coprinopsis cinerea okayama7|uniref:Uncharacterized protein n=1 Tax=Coprinopsis cinerea (strain Okayama-7 / 130 / ATCC MYA-4618 / FGSC 9003) TaxID=240176 RepID=A8PD88_COPC7|nr:hypothetical protein CC1G_13069 [Coprinopsis cinerea okayama7\|eukprot:XP_001840557.2 hypothetical protein CC1G_13069 [Coprinopsis cinerea okayama7\
MRLALSFSSASSCMVPSVGHHCSSTLVLRERRSQSQSVSPLSNGAFLPVYGRAFSDNFQVGSPDTAQIFWKGWWFPLGSSYLCASTSWAGGLP